MRNIFFASVLLLLACMPIMAESIDLLSPLDGAQINSKMPRFQIYFNGSESEYDVAICRIFVDGIEETESGLRVDANTIYTFTNAAEEILYGNHEWNAICDLQNSTTNDTIEDALVSETFGFYIIPISPSIELLSPADNAAINARTAEFSYKYNAGDTGAAVGKCELIIEVSIVGTQDANDGIETKFLANVAGGKNNWKIQCNRGGTDEVSSEYRVLNVQYPPTPSPAPASGGGSLSVPIAKEEWQAEYEKRANDQQQVQQEVAVDYNPKIAEHKKVLEPLGIIAPADAFVGEEIMIKVVDAAQTAVGRANIEILDPNSNLLLAQTLDDGTASFFAKDAGIYLYRLSDYEMASVPGTKVAKKSVANEKEIEERTMEGTGKASGTQKNADESGTNEKEKGRTGEPLTAAAMADEIGKNNGGSQQWQNSQILWFAIGMIFMAIVAFAISAFSKNPNAEE